MYKKMFEIICNIVYMDIIIKKEYSNLIKHDVLYKRAMLSCGYFKYFKK